MVSEVGVGRLAVRSTLDIRLLSPYIFSDLIEDGLCSLVEAQGWGKLLLEVLQGGLLFSMKVGLFCEVWDRLRFAMHSYFR